MGTTRSYRCVSCEEQVDLIQSLHEASQATCPSCGEAMQRFFGTASGQDMRVNLGFVPEHYSNETDARIAAFQFANL